MFGTRIKTDMNARHRTGLWALAGVFGLLAAGCGGGISTDDMPSGPTSVPAKAKEQPNVTAEAGIPVGVTGNGFADTMEVAKAKNFAIREDPFALRPNEVRYNNSQRSDRLLGDLGGFITVWEPPEEKPDPEQIREPQPYRRLAGVILGDAVLALIEMEDGNTYMVRPGMQIPNSEWSVYSITAERAILRRKGNKLPTEVAVNLESPQQPRGGGGGGGNEGGNTNPGESGPAPGGGPSRGGMEGGGGGGSAGRAN